MNTDKDSLEFDKFIEEYSDTDSNNNLKKVVTAQGKTGMLVKGRKMSRPIIVSADQKNNCI